MRFETVCLAGGEGEVRALVSRLSPSGGSSIVSEDAYDHKCPENGSNGEEDHGET
ncbi:hypothetical protein J3R74_001494 [Puniceicoccus vermicola]